MQRASFFILVALVTGSAAAPQNATEPLLDVRLYGHRGLTAEAPENSLAAVRAAMKLGIAGVEIDLRTTRDGEIVLLHDATLERTTDGSGPIAERSLSAVRGLRLCGNDGQPTQHRVPTLDEVISLVRSDPHFELALDLKSVDALSVADKVLDAGLEHRTTFFVASRFDVELARSLKERSGDLRIAVDLAEWWQIEGLATFVRDALEADALFALDYYFPRYGFREARDAGAEVHVLLRGERDLAERLGAAVQGGANVVSSDHPERLVHLAKPRPKP
ncbi:MAG: glycerophosphodiester phosphodiesterase family protein [Acidobacteriota bacterium]